MQISRHWRMNAQRYRLEGVRYQNGQFSLQNRPMIQEEESEKEEIEEPHQQEQMLAISAA